MNKYLGNVIFLLTLCFLLSFSATARNITSDKGSDDPVLFTQNDYAKADSVMKHMSLKRKIAQLMVVEVSERSGRVLSRLQNRLVSNYGVGGIIIMEGDLASSVKRVNYLNGMSRIPLLVTIDGEWGASMRFAELSKFPKQMQLGALGTDSLVFEMGKQVGKECAAIGINVNFAPDVDINNNPNNPVINTRSFGENKYKVADYGEAYLDGMLESGVVGVAKHFPGHGDTNVDSHKALPVLPFSRARLDSLELYPFRYLIGKGVRIIMAGHLEIPSLDSTGTAASISRPIISGLLKNKMGFDGLVCTDALNMKGVSAYLPPDKVSLAAFMAGADILLMPEDVPASIKAIEEAVYDNRVSLDYLNEKVRKILALKASCGMFDRSYKGAGSPFSVMAGLKRLSADKESLIERISGKSITVIRDSDAVLPLEKLKDLNVGVLSYGGEQYGKVFAESILKYCSADTIVLRGDISMHDIEDAKEKMKDDDLIILSVNRTDSRPQKNFGIDSLNMEYIAEWALSKNMIAVYMGSPYALDRMPYYKNFKAVVIGYQDTKFNNMAAAQVLFGGNAAAGILPVAAGGMPAGYSIGFGKTRLGYMDSFADSTLCVSEGVFKGKFIVSSERAAGSSCCDTLYADTPLVLNESAAFFSLLPQFCLLMDKGKFKATSFLGEVLKIKDPVQSRILLSDLATHHSGLPATGKDFSYNMKNAGGLAVNMQKNLIYSNVNLFYIRQIVLKYIAQYELSDDISNLFDGLGMHSTKLLPPSENSGYRLKTTLKDMSIFFQALYNGGTYGGFRFMSRSSAAFMCMIATYYSHDSSGLSFSLNPQTESVDYFLRNMNSPRLKIK